MKKDNALKNITRFDIPPKSPDKSGQYGWWVRMQKSGKKFQEFFNDKKYGGKEKALKAAQGFRDAIKVEYTERLGSKSINPRLVANKQSSSGIVGVNRTSYEYKKRGRTYKAVVWQANWPLGNGKYTSVSYSIKKHGEEEAFRLALAARENGIGKSEKQIYVDYYPPSNNQQKIWRYLDFSKFIAMLDSNSLFFPSASSFPDAFEGSYSIQNRELRGLIDKHKDPSDRQVVDMSELKKKVGISCWHANEFESAAMWELYSKSSEAVCIQSTYDRILLSLDEQAEIGMVQYVDYLSDFIPEHDPYLAFFHKRKSFEHESEIRAIVKELNKDEMDVGCAISIELDLLIENIYVSPESPEWFYKLVENSVKKYGLNKLVIKSSLADDPVY